MIPKTNIKNRLNRTEGFTMMELMVVLAVMSVLSVVAVFNYMPMRAKAADSMALSDAKNFADSVVKAITNSQDVEYTRAGVGGTIGNTDTAFNPRTPVFTLSPGVGVDISGDSAQGANNNITIVSATFYHTGGTDDGTTPSGKKEYVCVVDEAAGIITITIP